MDAKKDVTELRGEALLRQTAIELADATLALLHRAKGHPEQEVRLAYRTTLRDRQSTLFLRKLLLYRRLKERHGG